MGEPEFRKLLTFVAKNEKIYVPLLLLHHPRNRLQRALSFQRQEPPANVNFPISLVVTYAVAIIITILIAFFFPSRNGLIPELKQLNWASFLLVYRSGWDLGIAAVLVNVVASLILVPVAIFVFKDRLNWINIVGILVSLAGLVMLNWKR